MYQATRCHCDGGLRSNNHNRFDWNTADEDHSIVAEAKTRLRISGICKKYIS